MAGFLIRAPWGRYLQWHPGAHAFAFTPADEEFATVFTEGAALELADELPEAPVAVVPDAYYQRAPKFDVDDLCLRHRQVKPMSEYGIRYGGCRECEPPEADGEAFRGTEAAAYMAEQQHAAQRIKR